MATYDGIVKSYQVMAEFLHWQDDGVIIVPGLHGKDEILGTDGLQRAERLGKKFGLIVSSRRAADSKGSGENRRSLCNNRAVSFE